jgi:hypothetical protein
MSFEAAVASARGNDTMLAKSIIRRHGRKGHARLVFRAKDQVCVLMGIPSRQNHGKLQRIRKVLDLPDLFQCKQQQGESLKSLSIIIKDSCKLKA